LFVELRNDALGALLSVSTVEKKKKRKKSDGSAARDGLQVKIGHR
jgi:hypothetical protein